MTAAKQLVVTGSDTARRVSVYSVPTITRHQLLWIRANLAIFLSLNTYFITIKICTVFCIDRQLVRYPSLHSGEADVFLCVFFTFLISFELSYTAAEIGNENKNGLLHRMPEGASRNIHPDLLHVTGCRVKNVWLDGSVFIERLLQRHIYQLPN